MSALPQGSLILITGGNGYIGSHTVDQTLKSGLRVRAAVRSTAKGDALKAYFDPLYPGKLEYVVVPDMATEGGYAEAVRGVDGIIHMASVLPAREFPFTCLAFCNVTTWLTVTRLD